MKPSPASGSRGRRRGCLIFVLIVLALFVSGALLIGRAVGEAKRTEQTLNERFGEAPGFMPNPDGSIAPERVEAFLRVREQVRERCPAIQDRLGILADPGPGDGNSRETVEARGTVGGLKDLFSLGPAFLRFMETRNQALLNEEMGLGEYMYIYVLAYAEPLRRVRESSLADTEQAHVGDRARNELTRILRNQLNLLESGEIRSVHTGLAADLRDQIADLGAGRLGFPWEDGLPPAIAASLEPFAVPLARSHCEGIAKIELMQKNKGFNIKN